MKKLTFILLMGLTLLACKKEAPLENSPNVLAQNNCMGSTWKYEVTANPAVAVGSINILYAIGDGAGNTMFDTTLVSVWNKSITITQPLQGTETSYPITLQASKLKAIGTTTVTLRIYKNNTEILPATSQVLTGTLVNQTSCQ